ncbi:hypothetical protein [Pseudomonas fluorescens]|uniref:oxidoreductase n=1 Tax=Pseudomonas fluorescens TaxID=294 RepID=UPI0021E51BAB|nr:hypothetical protein [Pseudomonas fluorescens]
MTAYAAGVPRAFTATYYTQRASAGLIISEAINISADAFGSPLTPGFCSERQIAAWQKVTSAVHAAGGKIFAQLWYTGRVGHSSVHGGLLPVAPSCCCDPRPAAFHPWKVWRITRYCAH